MNEERRKIVYCLAEIESQISAIVANPTLSDAAKQDLQQARAAILNAYTLAFRVRRVLPKPPTKTSSNDPGKAKPIQQKQANKLLSSSKQHTLTSSTVPTHPKNSQSETFTQSQRDPRDGGKELSQSRRDHGRFGSLPLFDDYSEDSSPY